MLLTILLLQLLAGAGATRAAARRPRRRAAARSAPRPRTARSPGAGRAASVVRSTRPPYPRRDVEPSAAVRPPGYLHPLEAPDGIPGSVLTGPFPVGQYAAALRDRLRGFTSVQVFGEVFGFKAGRAKVWFELRDAAGALPCSMWREDFDKLRLGPLADGAQVVVAGGCDYYPGSRTASPSFSFAVTRLRVAGEGDLLAQLEQLRRKLDAEGLFAPQKALPRPRCRAASASSPGESGQGPRRRAGRPAPARLGGTARVGASRPCRTATRRRRCAARCRTSRRARRSR